ncbi:MAG TPA: hypothetical protein VFU00_01340 [Gemmatimonadales bacterium]|nr:hypothetical protein [Gemmatimonadales bacterium]
MKTVSLTLLLAGLFGAGCAPAPGATSPAPVPEKPELPPVAASLGTIEVPLIFQGSAPLPARPVLPPVPAALINLSVPVSIER